jgi:tight adherence protein B
MIMIAIFVVLAIGGFAFLSGFDLRSEQARVMRERLLSLDTAAKRTGGHEAAVLRDELLSSIPALNNVLTQSPRILRLQKYISQADLKTRAGKLLLICACVGAAAALLANVFAPGGFAFLALVMGCLLPFGYVAYKRSKRFRHFEELFPQAVELLARAVRAGHSFSSSLELIANELGEPVSGEFRKLYEEQKYGLPIKDALLNLGERMPLVDVRFFAVSVILQRDTGGNLAEILDKLSYVIRERFKILRQLRVFTAQGRMSMLILISLPFIMAVMMSLIAPKYLNILVTDPMGRNLIVLGFAMLATGFFFIRRIVNIRV